MTGNPTRLRVLALYKELHRLGRDYRTVFRFSDRFHV
jgi:hypothetical protein